MTITFFTIFPEYFESVLQSSILKRAQEKELVAFACVNIRDFAEDKHRLTDDRPYGGGAGMVMKVEPLDKALEQWKNTYYGQNNLVLATSASGTKFTQLKATQLALIDNIALICGHYEGIDQRVLDYLIDEEIRIGDYVLTGGEPAAAVIADAVTRLVPGVLGNDESIAGESHEQPGLGNFPQYTQPREYKGWEVPEVLLGGNHADIQAWREQNRKVIQD